MPSHLWLDRCGKYILGFPVTGKELKQKPTQAVTKTVEEMVSCAFPPGALLSPPGCSSTQSQAYF